MSYGAGIGFSLSDFDPVIPAIAKVIDVAECPFPVQRFDQSLAGLRVHGRPHPSESGIP